MPFPQISTFQSTLPARGATVVRLALSQWLADFNPRSPHGERRKFAGVQFQPADFNPRSPHGERRCNRRTMCVRRHFNPRSPHGERRPGGCRRAPPQEISIHAPRTGSDMEALARTFQWLANFNPRSPHGERLSRLNCVIQSSDFNPRSPHGERLRPYLWIPNAIQFQSTLPARGATLLSS